MKNSLISKLPTEQSSGKHIPKSTKHSDKAVIKTDNFDLEIIFDSDNDSDCEFLGFHV